MQKNEKISTRSPLDLLKDAAVDESFQHFKTHMAASLLFPVKRHQRQYCIRRAISQFCRSELFLEFGVYKGAGLSLFANELKAIEAQVYGFDSFEGIEEDWTGNHNGRPAGSYSLRGKAPKIDTNAHLCEGLIQETLDGFLEEHQGKIVAFAHMDFDTYTPTEYALRKIMPRLTKGSILLFDELYGYPGWKDHEYKALTETIPSSSYKYICFSREAVGIEIIDE